MFYALPNAFLPVPAVQVTANRDAPRSTRRSSRRSSDALKQQNIASSRCRACKGDHLLASFVNADVQKSGADAIKAALGDDYTVAFNLQSTVPGWLARDRRPLDAAGPGPAGRRALPDAGRQNDVIDKQESSYADDIRSLLREKNIRYESVTRNAVRGQGVPWC